MGNGVSVPEVIDSRAKFLKKTYDVLGLEEPCQTHLDPRSLCLECPLDFLGDGCGHKIRAREIVKDPKLFSLLQTLPRAPRLPTKVENPDYSQFPQRG